MTKAAKKPEKKTPAKPAPTPPTPHLETLPGAGVTRVDLKKIGKEEVVVTTWHGGTTLQELAKTFGLQPERAFYKGVLKYAVNKAARRSLFDKDWMDGEPKLRDDGAITAKLKKDAEGVAATRGGSVPRYYILTPEDGAAVDVALPYSPEFAKVLEGVARERERQTVVAKMKDVRETLYKRLWKLDGLIKEIDELVHRVAKDSAAALREIALLEAAHVVVRSCLYHHAGKLGQHDEVWLAHEISPAIGNLKEACYALMVHDSVGWEANREWRKEIEEKGDQVLRLLQDPKLIEEVGFVVRHPDAVDHNLWRHLPLYLQRINDTMLRTSLAERYVKEQLDPMIDEFARAAKLEPGVGAPKLPGFDAALQKEIPPPTSKGPLQAVAYYATLFGYAGGNLPGPASLSVLLHNAAAPVLMKRAVALTSRAQVGAFTARQYRFLVAVADLNGQEQRLLAASVDGLDPSKAKDIAWDKKFMNSPGWGAAITAVSLITLWAAIDDDEATTLKRVTSIVSSSIGVGLGLATMFQRYTKLYEKGLIGGAGKVVGVVASLVSVASSYQAYSQAKDRGDTFGMYSGGAATAGAAASVVGFLLSSGIVAGSTVVGAPIGAVLELLGLTLLVITTIGEYIVGRRTTKTEAMLKGLIEAFGRTYLDDKDKELAQFWVARRQSKKLDELYKELWRLIDQSWYMDAPNIDKAIAPQLFDAGFTYEQVAAFTAQSNIDAWSQLMQADRDPGPWKK